MVINGFLDPKTICLDINFVKIEPVVAELARKRYFGFSGTPGGPERALLDLGPQNSGKPH